eukprot:jgi/Bigna1/133962/aug1.23_g8670
MARFFTDTGCAYEASWVCTKLVILPHRSIELRYSSQGNMETLDAKKKATLQEYQMVVNANDINASIQILNDCKWNLENAINTAFELQKSVPLLILQRPRLIIWKFTALHSELRAPINTLMEAGLSFMGPIAHRVLPHWAAESQNVAPRAFARKLKGQVPALPNFLEGKNPKPPQLARAQGRSLFVYIHCPQHEDTEKFITTSLCNELIRDSLNSNFVCWAGSVTQTDTYKLCSRLRVEGYPCIAVVNPHREATRIPVPTHEGLFPVEQMVTWLHEVKQKYETQVAEARRRNVEVKQNSQLREIQDMEYIQALEADRKREEAERQKKELEAVAEMEEKKRKEEEERKRREEDEAEEKRAQDKLSRREKLMANEPPMGPGVVLVAIRLPDGQQIKRRFPQEEKFGTLFSLVQTYDLLTPHGDEIEKWVLKSRFPSKKWEDASMTLKDAKMGRQAMFFVQEDL